MLVSLYTSRVILNTLGVEDYGIYNVVGGVVALFGFITSSMSSATSRFLTYDLGLNNIDELKKTFSAAITVHLLIAILILLLSETLGLWFLENKLVIDSTRMSATRVVYQLSILNSIISILISPFTASVLSHERMNVYALIEIIIVILKLFAVILLTHGPFDKLITYSALLLIISFIHFVTYLVYCKRNFIECTFKFSSEIDKIKPILNFSGWDLYGNMSTVARTQGVNMLLNMFFGTVLNAASGIATQIQGALSSFASNILVAVRPQVVKSYANNNYSYTTYLLNNTTKYSSILLLVIFIPIVIEMPFILRVWLINVPEYTVDLSRLTLLFTFIANISSVIMSGIHATGKIKRSSVWNGTIYLSVIPITYFAFKNNFSPVFPFVVNAISVAIGATLNMWYLSKYMKEFSISVFLRKSVMPVLMIGAVSFTLCLVIKPYLNNNWLRLLLISLFSTFIVFQLSYSLLLSKSQKLMIKNYIEKWKKRKD